MFWYIYIFVFLSISLYIYSVMKSSTVSYINVSSGNDVRQTLVSNVYKRLRFYPASGYTGLQFHEFRSLDQDSREREACYSRPRVARAREHVIAKYSCALLFHVQVILELLIASFRWLKLKVTSCFSFQIVHELLNQAPPMYIFAWFRAKFQDRNWNKCRENVTKYHGTMFRSWKLNFVFYR